MDENIRCFLTVRWAKMLLGIFAQIDAARARNQPE